MCVCVFLFPSKTQPSQNRHARARSFSRIPSWVPIYFDTRKPICSGRAEWGRLIHSPVNRSEQWFQPWLPFAVRNGFRNHPQKHLHGHEVIFCKLSCIWPGAYRFYLWGLLPEKPGLESYGYWALIWETGLAYHFSSACFYCRIEHSVLNYGKSVWRHTSCIKLVQLYVFKVIAYLCRLRLQDYALLTFETQILCTHAQKSSAC